MNIDEAIKSIHKMGLTTKTVINIMYTSRIIEESILAVLKPYDITPQQYNVMRILRGQKGNPANLSTIQERMVDRNSNTTRLVDKLIKKDFAKRNICAENRRKVEIFITETGLDTLRELDPIIERHNEATVASLNQTELEQLNHLLNNLRKQ